MQRAFRGPRAISLAAAFIVVVAACNPPSQAGASGGSGNLTVTSPAEGSTVSIPFEVQVDAGVPLGEPSTGNQHLHFYYDSDTSAADYDIVYGSTGQVTRQLTPGEHTITIALANPDHSLAGPTTTLHVTVGSGGGGGGGSTVPPPTTPGY